MSIRKTAGQEHNGQPNTFILGQSDYYPVGNNQPLFSCLGDDIYGENNNIPIGVNTEIVVENPYDVEIGSSVDDNEYFRTLNDSNSSIKYPIGTAIYDEGKQYWSDFKNLYTLSNAGNYAIALGVAGGLANTSTDKRFVDWYQDDIRSQGTDDASRIFKVFGEGKYLFPVYIGGSLVYCYLEEQDTFSIGKNGNVVGEFVSRCTRSTIIGSPTLLVGQAMLGAGRPTEYYRSSYWRPFNDNNGISGHAYMGSIPFLTAAEMTDSSLLKGLFYTGSTWTGWSRINDNAHYLSQVILGWYLGYLSVRATSTTENQTLSRGLTLFPILCDETTGIGFSWEY